jgi:hypothetical protein
MKARAYKFLRGAFKDNWAIDPEVPDHAIIARPRHVGALKKVKLFGLAGMLQLMPSTEDEDMSGPATVDSTETDSPAVVERKQLLEVEEYLRLPQVPTHCDDGRDFDLCMWWKSHAQMLPHLHNMARTHHALPASSAGVKRLLSAVGRMHVHLKKNTSESILESSLMVFKNT